jgi:hypothetical protein
MATYIQGIQDYIPQIQPFKPDFNFFQSALEQKQQQYQAGYNKISAMYGQLLNSELLRDANKERRDALFTEIDSDIKRLSGVDLSLQENVQEASKLFQPLISNDYFRKDVAFTKQYYAQVRRAEALQRNPDPKSDERFWQEGMTALHYQAEDFSKSTDDESMRYRNPLYTPKVDVTEKLFKFAKDNDINPESLEYKGGYIFKYTNGVPAISTLQNTFSSVLLSDPRIKAMTDTEAYLERKNYSKENATRFNGDEMAAETEYLQNKIAEINKYYAEANKRTQETAAKVNTTRNVIEDRVKTHGIDPDLDQDLVKMYQGTMTDQSVVASNDQKNKEVISQVDGIDMNALDRESLRYRVDNALSYFKLDGLASQTAQQYAMSKQKIDFKVDEYALAATKHRYAMIEQDDQQEHDKKMKLMDIVGNILKESGNAQAGNSLNPFYSTGLNFTIPGLGNVTLDNIDIQAGNEGAAQSKVKQNTTLVDQNIESFLRVQNSIIKNPDSTPEQIAAAQQAVESRLGIYQVVDKQDPYTKTEYGDLTDQGTLTDIAQTIGGIAMTPGIQAVPIIGPLLGVIGAGARVAGAAGIAGPGLAAQGGKNLYGEVAGTEVTTPELVTKSKGLVTKDANGTYTLVPRDKRTHFTDPNSESYYNNVNKQVLEGLNETQNLYKGTPYDQPIATEMQAVNLRQGKLDTNNKLVEGINRIVTENNTMLSTAMANEAGTSAENAKLYWKPDMTGSRTENEFVAAYVEANKNNTKDYPQTTFMSYIIGSTFSDFTGDRTYTVSEEERLEDMREDAIDMYEELTEAHQTLSKNPEGNLKLKSVFSDDLSSEEGINRYYSTAAAYGFDAALWNTPAFMMGMDFFTKDFLPNTASPSFRDENGVKVVYGSGLDITRDEYAEMEHDPKAEMALKAFLASSSMNYGGKTGENQKRPTGAYYLSAIAANDGNKIAMTWDISPDWVKDHAGKEANPGPTWDLQQKVSTGGDKEGALKDYKITFFIDADKAKSMPFQAMQMTDEEMLMNMDGSITLDAFSKNAGLLSVTKNALGGYNYSGYAKAMDELGNILNNPIFGTSDSDLNATMGQLNNFLSQVSMSNLQQEAALRDPNNLQYDPTALLETE